MKIIRSSINEPPEKEKSHADLGALIGWLTSWIQDSGAIHGFHNHSVWGGNPYRWGDFTAGHTTFSSLLIPTLARLHSRGVEGTGPLLERTLSFQIKSRQANGKFDHIGFQIGESLRLGLIHCMVPCISLHLALAEMSTEFAARYKSSLLQTVNDVLNACDFYGPRATPSSCANQEYARQWVRLLHARATGNTTLEKMALEDLDLLASHFLVHGLPDEASCGVLRVATDRAVIEPAEYYGLMIEPLVLAYEITGQKAWLDQALCMARHVVRSSWIDQAGQRRFHRLYHQTPDGSYTRINEPMLIAGMGLTLESIRKCSILTGDGELSRFVIECHHTLAHYQHPSGFFLSATGWNNEADFVPCPAWHSHDAWHLLLAAERDCAGLQILEPGDTISLMLGDSGYYAECDRHWRIGDYLTQDTYCLLGRKDEVHFGRDMSWIGGPNALPPNYQFPHNFQILKTDRALIFIHAPPSTVRIFNSSSLPVQLP